MVIRSLLVAASLASAPAAAGEGATLAAGYTSFYGPDAYGVLRVRAHGEQGLEVGALAIGGSRSAALMTAARTTRAADALDVRGELLLGMARRGLTEDLDQGPAAGAVIATRAQVGSIALVAEAGWLLGIGEHAELGADAPLSPRLWVLPRLRLETWAGRRDPALRAAIGARHALSGGWFYEASASAGGRDVIHMGPGALIVVGRLQ